MATYYDRVRAYSLSTGTGPLTIGLAVPQFRTFDDADVPDGTEVDYLILSGLDWEIGTGTYTGGVLSRNTVSSSSNAGAKIEVLLNAIVANVFNAERINAAAESAEAADEAEAAAAAAAASAAAAAAAAASVPSVDTDGTFAANSDAVVPSQKAAKTYVDAAITAIKNGVSSSFDTLAEIATDLGLKMVKTANLSDVANAATAFANIKQAATDAATGVVEIATVAEINAGTDTARVPSVDNLAGSIFGQEVVQVLVFDDSQNNAVGDGAGDVFFRIPTKLNGMNLVAVGAQVQTAGTTGTQDIQIARIRAGAAVDMLSTKMTIDSTEIDTSTAATPAVINGANDDVATGDQIRIDVDAVQTTPAKGLVVTMTFQLP